MHLRPALLLLAAGALLLVLLDTATAAAQEDPVLRSGAARITLGGRVHTQFNTTTEEDEPAGEWLLRRVRLETRVVVNELVSGRIVPDFAGNRLSLKDAYLMLHPADGVEILAGRAHRPFSTLTQYSSLRMGPIEKGLAIRGLEAWDEQELLNELDYTNRDVGLQIFVAPDSAPAGLDAAFALLQGPLGDRAIGRHTFQLVSSVGVRPMGHLELRAGWSRRHFLREDSALTAGNALLASAGWDPPAGLYLLAEATTGDFDPTADVRFDAAHLWSGYRVPLTGRISMIEPIVRVSHGDVSDPSIPDGTLLTGGVNLYFGGLNRLMVDYDAWRASSGGNDAGSFKVMFQLAF